MAENYVGKTVVANLFRGFEEVIKKQKWKIR